MTFTPPSRAPPAATFALRTLGGASLSSAGTDALLAAGKPLALLIYVALTPGRRTSREFLVDLLWADLDPNRARGALRQALFHLRRQLGEGAISGTEELILGVEIETDRDRFLRCIEDGNLETALDLYAGPFLPSFGVPGGAAFEHWADLERERLQSTYLRSAEIQVRRQLNESRFKDAQRLAKRARDFMPHEEAAWRLLLESIVVGRDFLGAAVEADALERWSSVEDIFLEPATRLAIARARQLTPDQHSGGRESFDLVAELTGREREFFAITAAWDGARTGASRHVHLTAPPGLGKTRLLRDAVARLAATGAPVVRVQGKAGDREVPYALASDLAQALAELPGAAGIAPASASTLIALNPALSGSLTGVAEATSGDDALRRRILALTDLVQAVADEQPFVLAIDDLHWIDRPSYRVLEGMWSRLHGAPVLCLTASRPERLPSGDGFTKLPLAPLSPIQVSSLVSALASIPADQEWSARFVAKLHDATGGSPLLVLETLRLAIDRNLLALDHDEWQCLDEPGLESLLKTGEALRERVRALPPAQGWALALLATAGTPLQTDALADAVAASSSELRDTLAPIEQQGLVAKTSTGWVTAHDEIAAAARDALKTEDRFRADRTIGAYFARLADHDPHRLLRAAHHFGAAGDVDSVTQLHRKYALLARRRGDRRPFAQITSEFLGAESGSVRVASLTRSLPRTWRLGLWSRARQTGVIASLFIVTATGTAASRWRTATAATLQRVVFVDSSGATSEIPIRSGDWDGTSAPLTPSRSVSAMAEAAQHFAEIPPAISPDGEAVAWIQNTGDSTTLDVWLRTPAGVRRLTHEPRDDLVNGWLPDGSALIGTTNRWSPPSDGDYDIAVFDTATGAARQVTRGPSHDTAPYASPDGTRIAFIRSTDDVESMICVVDLAGRDEPDCRLIGGRTVGGLLGWSSLSELAIITIGPNDRPLVLLDWSRDVQSVVLPGHVIRGLLSPDRRWIAAAARRDGIRGLREWIIPLRQPGLARQVAGSAELAQGIIWWEGRRSKDLLIDRVEFSDSVREIMPGIGTRLRVRPLTAAGVEIPVHGPVVWATSDSLVASVDSTGEVRVASPGSVRITASLGGWRTATALFHVAGAAPTTVLTERWDDDWRRRWIAWGDPLPVVAVGPEGIPGLWNHGDGTYQSFVVLRRSLDVTDGFGAEFRVSTPLTQTKWHRLRVAIVADVDTAALVASDQQKAPPSLGHLEAMCGFNYPEGDGTWGFTSIAVAGAVTRTMNLGEAGRPLRSGAWWTLRLQILPDGRCGIAINHRVVGISPEPIPLDRAYWLRLGDASAVTRLLYGPFEAWRGVRTDIDWSKGPR